MFQFGFHASPSAIAASFFPRVPGPRRPPHLATATSQPCDMLSGESMKRDLLITTFALFATASFAQTPASPSAQPAGQRQGQRPAMADTPNTDIYYRLAPDAIPQEGVPKG